ncbi:(Na+)-NQR maturation NqrM [Ferrimonas aestuarii]|uniref:(Na+)-NQR maturation NqrM n=1 Tax=Ferrimonas aestuarii TaxID=2569539 RepID=A0A4U1BQW1_9GAMM|nr:(Na+)-NQR maturation NqrM [Ferrimonas aestuarii]TKB56538.1 (Na+)-NQR maturation NqrM [Ferrimonas aestuarii]
MSTFIITFAILMGVTALMAVGYIIKRKTISGSCGGLGGIGIEKACDCPEPCDRRKKLMAKQEAEAQRSAKLEQMRIL